MLMFDDDHTQIPKKNLQMSAFCPALDINLWVRSHSHLCVSPWRESRCDKLFSVKKRKQREGQEQHQKCVKVQQMFPPACCVLKENMKVLCPGACCFMLAVIRAETNAEQLLWKYKKKVYCLIGYGNLWS